MTEIVQIRVDDELKTRASKLFESMGLDLSTAVRMFLVQCVNLNKIPFEVTADNVKKNGLEALERATKAAAENGISDMTLDEINQIITEVRKERKGRKNKK